MTKLLATSFVGVVFVLGIVVGVFGGQLFDHLHADGHFGGAEHRQTTDSAELHQALVSLTPSQHLDELTRMLELSAEQRHAIHQILHDSQRGVRALHDELLPRVLEHLEDVHVEIADLLDDDQKARLHDLRDLHHQLIEHSLHGGNREEHGEPRRGSGHP